MMTKSRPRTCYFFLAGCSFLSGPAYLGLARLGMSVYLLNPVIFTAQSLPYLLGAALCFRGALPVPVALVRCLLAPQLPLSSASLWSPPCGLPVGTWWP